MKLAKMQDEKELVPYNQAAPQGVMPEQGMGQQFMDMAKQKAMSTALNKGTETAMGALGSSGAMTGAATAMPYVGMGLMGAKLLGLFNHGGHIGPLSPQYNVEGENVMPTFNSPYNYYTMPLAEPSNELPPKPVMPMPVPMQPNQLPAMPVPMQTMPPTQSMSPVMSEIDKMRAEYLKSLGV